MNFLKKQLGLVIAILLIPIAAVKYCFDNELDWYSNLLIKLENKLNIK